MNKKFTLCALAVLILASAAFSQGFANVGAQKCQICHKTEKQGQQYALWEATNHAKSFTAWPPPEAAKACQALGVEKPADDPRCLKCHAPLAEKAPELKAEGVSCEVCHGPGSEYKKLAVMKDKAEATKNGLILYGSPDAIKAHCLKCHENPHGKPLDFAAAWEKIKHPVPGK